MYHSVRLDWLFCLWIFPFGRHENHRTHIKAKIPYMTTIAAARATAEGILQVQRAANEEVHSLQELHAQIKDPS